MASPLPSESPSRSGSVRRHTQLPAFGGELQPGLHPPLRKFANPAPLGLSAFALTTFVLSLINVRTRGVSHPDLIISLAYGYGGLLQLISGMWYVLLKEYLCGHSSRLTNAPQGMAVGNTFAATAMASYGGFWIALAIILTPGFGIESSIGAASPDYANSFGFFLIVCPSNSVVRYTCRSHWLIRNIQAWFIFTTILLLCTLRSTLALFLTIFFLDMTFLFLAIGYLLNENGVPREGAIRAGGWVGLITSFCAWYNALAGLLDRSNRCSPSPLPPQHKLCPQLRTQLIC